MIDTTKLVSLEQTLDAFDNIVSVIRLKDVDVGMIGNDIKIGADFEGVGVITKLSFYNPLYYSATELYCLELTCETKK